VHVQPRAAELVLVDIRGSGTDADPGRGVQPAVLVGKGAAGATARSSGDDERKRDQGEEGTRERTEKVMIGWMYAWGCTGVTQKPATSRLYTVGTAMFRIYWLGNRPGMNELERGK
jgi:hypothetical protein